jgi:hypothetical protein
MLRLKTSEAQLIRVDPAKRVAYTIKEATEMTGRSRGTIVRRINRRDVAGIDGNHLPVRSMQQTLCTQSS